MASTFEYTTNTKVVSVASNYNASKITTTEIDGFITNAEGFINALTQHNWTSKTTVPEIITRLATHLAAFTTILSEPSTFSTLSEAQSILDALFVDIERDIVVLQDPKVIKYLKGLV